MVAHPTLLMSDVLMSDVHTHRPHWQPSALAHSCQVPPGRPSSSLIAPAASLHSVHASRLPSVRAGRSNRPSWVMPWVAGWVNSVAVHTRSPPAQHFCIRTHPQTQWLCI